MRTIIAGSRAITDIRLISDAVEAADWSITAVLSGGARGVDNLGERYAAEGGIPLEIYPADWGRYGKGAGRIRNAEMASKAEALIAIWDGKSKGTKNMINIARMTGLSILIWGQLQISVSNA